MMGDLDLVFWGLKNFISSTFPTGDDRESLNNFSQPARSVGISQGPSSLLKDVPICYFFSGTSWDDKRSLQLTSSACSVRCRFLQYSETVFAELVDRIFPDIQIYMTNVKSEDAIGNASSFWVLLQAPLKESRLYELRVLLGSHGEFVGHSPALMARSCPFNWNIYTYEKINEHDTMIMKLWYSLTDHGIWWKFRAFPTFSISDRTKASW